MKIVHAADLHIDSPMVGIEKYDGVPVAELRGATREAFKNLVALVLEEDAKLLLLAGDLFDDNWRDYATGLFFLNELSRLGRAGVHVAIVRGNHDAQSKMTRSLRLPPHVTILDSKKPETRIFDELGIALHGQSYAERMTPHDLAAKYPAAVSGLVNIGLLHTSLDGRPGHLTYAPTTPAILSARGYDYWALGHVHAREVVSRDPWIVYPGNLQGRHAKESGAKGATVITIGDQKITAVEHRALDVARWFSLSIDAETAEDDEAVLARVAKEFEHAATSLDARIGVARVRIRASERLHGALLQSEGFTAEVRRIANEAADGELVAERIVIDAAPRRSAQEPLFAALVESVPRPDVDEAFLARARERLNELVVRLPESVKKDLAWDDDESLRALTTDAWSLVARALREDEA